MWRTLRLPAIAEPDDALDVRRMPDRPDEVRKLVRDVAEAEGYAVTVLLPQDPAGEVDQTESYVRCRPVSGSRRRA